MNYEVWLMLLGYNIDFWETHDIEKKTIGEFGKVLLGRRSHPLSQDYCEG